MRRRSGQSGQIVRKGYTWHVRFYVDVAWREKRLRKSVPVGPATGKERLTKPEAARKADAIIAAVGVNTPQHLDAAQNPKPVVTFGDRVHWCRRFHKAWTEGKPGPVQTMDGQLKNHILPTLGEMALDAVSEGAVQELAADLRRRTFERRKPDGTLIKTYRLSRKTILNVVGVIKLVVGRKVWMTCRNAASRVGLDLIVGPKPSTWAQPSLEGEVTVKATA